MPFASSSPLTTKHSDWYVQTFAPIIDLFICLEYCCHVTSTNVNCNCHCSLVVTSRLTIVTETKFRHICWQILCQFLSSPNGCNNLWKCYQVKANELILRRIECIINGRYVFRSSKTFWREKDVRTFYCKQFALEIWLHKTIWQMVELCSTT